MKAINIFLFAFFFLNFSELTGFEKMKFHHYVDDIIVETVTVEEVSKLISDRQGKPLLLNVWATWCAPCREEFPELVKLAELYAEQLDVIGISVDFPEEIDSKVLPFLESQNAFFPNFVLDVRDPMEFINLLDEDWNGAIPATFIYTEDGEQVGSLIGQQSFDEFVKAIP